MITRRLRVPRFIRESILVLPLGCVVAILWTTAAPDTYYRFAHAMTFAVNEVAIALFFGLMTRHVVDETLAGGSLHSWRRAGLPIAAALGGILVPVGFYVVVLRAMEEPMLVSAWAVTAAVDVAIGFFVAELIFGRHATRAFVVLLGLVSNAIGLTVIAIQEPTSRGHAALGLALFLSALGVALALRRQKMASFWPYLLVAGGLSWAGLYIAGVHPALALVPIVPFMPHARRDPGLFEDPRPEDQTTLSRFERASSPFVQVILFVFGLVNAGVPLHGLDVGMWAFPIAVFLGRPIGVLLATGLAAAVGIRRPEAMGVRELLVIGLITSTGLSMALFLSTALLATGPLLMQLESGSLLSVIGVVVAPVVARALHVGRFKAKTAERARP